MQQLPNWLKWIIVVATLALCVGVLAYVNARAAATDMPAPDDMFGLYDTTSVSF